MFSGWLILEDPCGLHIGRTVSNMDSILEAFAELIVGVLFGAIELLLEALLEFCSDRTLLFSPG